MKLRLPLRKQRAERKTQNKPDVTLNMTVTDEATPALEDAARRAAELREEHEIPEPERELEIVDWPLTDDPPLQDSTQRVVEALDNAARHAKRDPNTGRYTKHNGDDAA